MKRIAIFASGSGSNAENIATFLKDRPKLKVELILTNNPNAGVIERAKKLDIPCILFDKEQFYRPGYISEILEKHDIGFIVLAGFLWMLPFEILDLFPKKVINIHPALLPKHGGKGMYGDKVHRAVLNDKEKESGITIHYVNEKYDEGEIIFQAICEVDENDTIISLAQKVHALEYKYYPKIIEFLLSD